MRFLRKLPRTVFRGRKFFLHLRGETLIFILSCALLSGVITNGFSQDGPPPPPPPGGGHGSGENQAPGPPQGGNASAGGGIALLLGLCMLYGVKRLADARLGNTNQSE
jgi:hypothetical protein